MSAFANIKGPLFVLLLGVVLLIAWYFGKQMMDNDSVLSTSDADSNAEVIKIGADGYLGYWFLTSPRMKSTSPRMHFRVNLSDDGGAYAERLEKFNAGEYDAIVLPVNSYLEHGKKHGFPGVIVAAISESKGADAIVGYPDVLPSGKINDLNDDQLKFVYTGQSPSSFLLDLCISDFDLDKLQNTNSWKQEVMSSEEVYDIAKKSKKDRKQGDVFVMWEPEVSKSIEKLGLKELWSSANFAGYIVDVIVFHRNVVKKKPELIQNFMTTYFRTLDFYAGNKDEMIKAMSDDTDMDDEVVQKMADRIDWYDKNENAHLLFGVQHPSGGEVSDKMVSTILACADVMERTSGYDASQADPYTLMNSSFLARLIEEGMQNVGDQSLVETKEFSELSEVQWKKMREIGTMRVEPITFQSGTSSLDISGKEVLNKVAGILANNYPDYRVVVRGHTGDGDADANMVLSQERALAIEALLISENGISANRLNSEGVGATMPPVRKSGEGERAFRFRKPRVEFILVSENAL